MPYFFWLYRQKYRTFRAPHSWPPVEVPCALPPSLQQSQDTKTGRSPRQCLPVLSLLYYVVRSRCFALTRPLVHATIIAHLNVSLCLMFLSALPLLPVVSVHSAPPVCPCRPLAPPAAASVSSAVSALLSFCTGSHCLRALHCLSSASGFSCLSCYVCTAADAPALISCVSESDTCICSGSLICSRSGHLIFPEKKTATNTPPCFFVVLRCREMDVL